MTKQTIEVLEALRRDYPSPDKAFIAEFRGGTGWSRESRADGIAMDLWPSHGLELIGFEIKTSRADWLRELKNPLKADPIKQFCDRWYLVTPDKYSVFRYGTDTLPEGWGHMCLEWDGTKRIIEVVKEAPKLKPEPIDRLFLASLMRLASRDFAEILINGRKYKAEN